MAYNLSKKFPRSTGSNKKLSGVTPGRQKNKKQEKQDIFAYSKEQGGYPYMHTSDNLFFYTQLSCSSEQGQ